MSSKRLTPNGHADDPPHPAEGVISRTFGESAVLIRLRTNRIYELNDTGARIWDLIQAGSTREQLIERLLTEFDVEHERLTEAVDTFLGELRVDGLTT
jgi:Coenzyme PQQ synthesis protein D (PqqD)